MNPIPNCVKFLVATLKADAAVVALVNARVYANQPPEKVNGNGTAFPCIVVSLHTSRGINAVGMNEVQFVEPVFLVKGIATGNDTGGAHEIANAATDALNGAAYPTDVEYNGRRVSLQGIRAQNDWVDYPEVGGEGVRYNHVGQTFRLFVSNLRP